MNPVSAAFGLGVRLRNTLYDRGVFKRQTLSRPVISIGNISVGGSGKTPFIMTLGGLLRDRGIEVDVLSRGYGRESKEITVVNSAGSPQQFGDEPLLIARRLGVPVVVGADRYQVGLLAEKEFPQSRLHLLDDGFQHRRLHRDFDIVLLQPADFKDTLLPIGRLREDFSALGRADAITLLPETPFPVWGTRKPVWQLRKNVHFIAPMSRLVAFCGIARPEQFFSGLRKLGMDLADTLTFGDHHGYTQRDIDRLLQAKAQSGARGFITTDKDAINLGPLAGQLRTFETAGLELELENAPQALETILQTLEQRCGCRF